MLDQFETTFGAQMDQVLDFWGLDYPFGGYVGVLKSVKFEVRRRRMPCLVFFKMSAVKGDYCSGVTSRSYFVFSV